MSGRETRWLVLFDIDGTLLRCGRQIRAIFGSALRDAFGTTGPLDAYDFAGRTDLGIVLDLMCAAGLEERAVRAALPAFQRLYFERLEERLEGAEMRLLPGLPDLLGDLERRADVTLGLLTGNFERGARIKLSRFDLNRFFAFGAFGEVAAERWRLPPVAVAGARDFAGRDHSPEEVVIIGDSVLDVECARRHGMTSIAVETGFTDRRALLGAGADWVVEDLVAAARVHPALSTSRRARV